MGVNYKVRSLRRLFGATSFFQPKKVTPASSGAARAGGDGGGEGRAERRRDSEGEGQEKLKVTKGGNGIPRAFFTGQAPRSVRGKSVGAQLFTVHLFEKQKMRLYYGAMRDGKFKKYVDEARRKRFNADAELVRALEMRLDTLLYRTAFAQTPAAVRQWIAHEHVMVNGQVAARRSTRLVPGDVISVRDRHIGVALKAAREHAATRKEVGLGLSWIFSGAPEGLCSWLEVDRVGLSAALVRYPTNEEVHAMCGASLFPFIRDAQLNPQAAMRAYR